MRDFQRPGRSAVYAVNAMAATSHPLATETAIAVMREGGNAVDAALAAALVLTVAEPHMCGLGGDCFALVHQPSEGRIVALNGSGRAPRALSAEALRARGLTAVPVYGPEAVTTPGAVAGFFSLHARYGRLDWDKLFVPAIAHAETGVPVAPRVAHDWAHEAEHLSAFARRFYLPFGRAPRVGERFVAPFLANAMRKIAAKGPAAMYEGEIADDIIATLQSAGGLHTGEDFASVTADWGAPISVVYRGVEVFEHPPNGQGATALLLLGILAHVELNRYEPFGAERLHFEAEATRLAYDARDRFIADPNVPGVSEKLAHMLAPATAARLAALIGPKRTRGPVAPFTEAIHRDTVSLCTVDQDRMAVSLIFSLYHPFGSGLASERFGILLQNRGAGFTLRPGHPNELAGGKRPLHTIIPGMARFADGVLMPFGVMGGAYQPTGHARLISNLVDYNLDLQEAIDAPRAFDGPEGFVLERDYRADVFAALRTRGHQPQPATAPLGGAQAIRIEPSGVLIGASDPRKDGCALGF